MFFPYRAQIALHRFPIITILLSLVCIGIYVAQAANERALLQSAMAFCQKPYERGFKQALAKLTGEADPSACVQALLGIHLAKDRRAEIAGIARRIGGVEGVSNADLSSYYEDALSETYRAFSRAAPDYLTARLWYPPDSWDVVRMLSASVSHGGWLHLIGNLFFFFAFAAAIEALLGVFLYAGVLVALALGTHTVYSLATMTQPEALPTLGLSGVIMGIMALFVFFLPMARIRCFLWLIVVYWRFAVPAWLLAAWFIGWDIYAQVSGEGDPRVNLIAHLSGAAIGLLLGMTLFRRKRHWARELVENEKRMA